MAHVVAHARSARGKGKEKGARRAACAAREPDAVDSALKPGGLLAALLADPVRFVGSSREALAASMSLDAARAARYEVVGGTGGDGAADGALGAAPRVRVRSGACAAPQAPAALYAPRLATRLPRVAGRGVGLYNRGNTCYMNSVMQALLHTAPLAAALLTQQLATLLGPYGVPPAAPHAPKAPFNAVAALKEFFERAWHSRGPVAPSAFVHSLRQFAKPLRPGRQEDAHEYLRLLLEAMQRASVGGAPEKLAPTNPLVYTTLVQRVFGGRLRSRVTCHSCRHNSDTYDPLLDLSLDVHRGINSVKQALDAFTAPESLTGANKYRCDSCKRHVDATKRFSIDAAPMALTVHLKRFGVLGNKISRMVGFGERLHLGRYMSARHRGLGADGGAADVSTIGAAQQYQLYAVVHHFGSGPNVGHYVASVRAPDGQWLRMDDAHVTPLSRSPVDDPSAYLLFYLREPVALDAAATVLGGTKRRANDGRAPPVPPAPSGRAVLGDPDDVLGEPLPRGAYAGGAEGDRVLGAREPPADARGASPFLSPRKKHKKRKIVSARPFS
ncbi:ubiquitinyl hydrolase 1 [Malassezia sp. CBS 17886]|nr:ubiquitinyl hydrolase 1 [Malassezia sp. CBS 17886]